MAHKTSTSLCYNASGLINPEAVEYIKTNEITDVILFGDGTKEALNHISAFDKTILGSHDVRIGIGRLPLYEMRVINLDGTVSKPNYVYTEDVKLKWVCAKVCTPHMEIYVSSTGSNNGTQVLLDRKQSESVCYMAHKLWSLILTIEERLSFPAVLIEALMKFEYLLTPQTMDINRLRKETGISSFQYSPESDMLYVIVNDDAFAIKLSVLNETYEKIILPFFNSINGGTMRMRVSIKGLPHYNESPIDMSYELLGRVVEDMRLGCREKKITYDSPIETSDLLLFAKKIRVDDQTCIWVDDDGTVSSIVEEYYPLFVRGSNSDDIDSTVDLKEDLHVA